MISCIAELTSSHLFRIAQSARVYVHPTVVVAPIEIEKHLHRNRNRKGAVRRPYGYGTVHPYNRNRKPYYTVTVGSLAFATGPLLILDFAL
jgi:hypothetical protein